MTEEGLRERKKQRTLEMICEVATELMVERGFDEVSIADIAAAADVSKMTVSNYFPAKEDIVLCQIADHIDEPATVVRSRGAQETPLAALRRNFLAQLTARDPITGLSSDPQVLAFRRLVLETPKLMRGVGAQLQRSETLLAEVFGETLKRGGDDATAALAAAQVIGVLRTLAERNLARSLAGASQRSARTAASAEATLAFELLEAGLGGSSLA